MAEWTRNLAGNYTNGDYVIIRRKSSKVFRKAPRRNPRYSLPAIVWEFRGVKFTSLQKAKQYAENL